MVSVVPYHRCIRVCMAGYNIGRIHVVTVRVKFSGAHIDTNASVLQGESTTELQRDILMINYDM